MSIITSSAISAYQSSLGIGKGIENKVATSLGKTDKPQQGSFMGALKDSVKKVNELQSQKNEMVESFASGETQNVHELMISLQKAGLAMNMTSAVRGKVLDAYRELTKMSF